MNEGNDGNDVKFLTESKSLQNLENPANSLNILEEKQKTLFTNDENDDHSKQRTLFTANDEEDQIKKNIIFLANEEEDNGNERKNRRNGFSESYMIPFLKKFINNLKKSSSFTKFKSLNEYGFTLIDDQTYFSKKEKYDYTKKGQSYENFSYLLRKFIINYLPRIEVFHPYNNLKITWDVVHFLIILILLFLIPIDVCFHLKVEESYKIALFLFFIGDILINFNTSFFYKGFMVKNRKTIIYHYLRRDFIMDTITLIFYFIDVQGNEYLNFLKLIFFFRWRKLEKINFRLQEKFRIGLRIHASVIDLINLLFFSFYILNFFACLWFYIAYVNEVEPTWLSINKLKFQNAFDQYVYSLYWSSVTIMTVGYGDIVATNITEIIFSIFTVFFGCGLFAYIINSIGIIVGDINKESNLFKSKMTVINKYMDKKNIDYNLQMKIREYLRFIWQEESTQNAEIETEIINKLSKSLKSELINESYGQILRKSPLFFANFSKKFLSELMYEFNEVRNIPEDTIFNQSQKDDCELYFVVKGKVELYYETTENEKKQIIKILKEGDNFGELAFFTGKSRSCSAKSKDFTTLFSIKRTSFLKLLSTNPDDYEKFCMIRDQLIFENNPKFLQTKCFACNSKDHMVLTCPLIHYIPDKLKIVKRYIKDPGQSNRIVFDRIREKANSFNSLLHQKTVKQSAEKLKEHSKYFSLINEESHNLKFQINKSDLKHNLDKLDEILENKELPQILQKIHNKTREITLRGLVNQDESILIENPEKEPESLIINEPNFEEFLDLNLKVEESFQNFMPTFQNPALATSFDQKFCKELKLESFTNLNLPEKKMIGNVPSITDISVYALGSLPINKNKEISKEIIKENDIKSSPPNSCPKQLTQSMIKEDSKAEIFVIEDYFEKEFEKGVNFKNFYPENNLEKFIEFTKEKKQEEKNTLKSKVQALSSFHLSRTVKNNRIFPSIFEETFSKSKTNGFKKKSNTKCSIFRKHASFYDVVNEVLYNQDLRKKMQLIRQKTIEQKKKKKYLN